jgi:putative endonuclease
MKSLKEWFSKGAVAYPDAPGLAGRMGEELAAQYLLKKGYRLIGQNVRSGPAEIDIIALDGDILCFVEVKCRKDNEQGDPEEYVDFRKQQRLVRGAACFHDRERYCAYRVRFDIVSVLEEEGRMKINHLENAFEVDP